MVPFVSRFVAPFVLAGALLSAPAIAAPEMDAPHTSVSYRDLDLSTDAGARILQQRVRRAAASVCGVFDQRDLPAVSHAMACRKMALQGAAPQMELALAAARSGRAYAYNDMAINAHGR